MRVVLYLFAMLIIMTVAGCGNSTESIGSAWKSLGFEDKFALRLVLSEPYLYVCAGSEGLWRRDISTVSSVEWEYLGLADTTLGNYSNRGVLDVVPDLNDHNSMLVAFDPDDAQDHGVFKSVDRGITWIPSDSGMAYELWGERYLSHPSRFIKHPSQIISAGTEIFYSDDFGISWNNMGPVWGPVTGQATYALEYHSKNTSNIWIGGESVYFGPILLYSVDSGNSWEYIDLIKIVPTDNAVYSIAFDPVDANIVYVGLQGAIIKTEDGGQTWIVPLVTSSKGGSFRAIESDSRNRNHLWAAAGRTIIETVDGGNKWSEIENPNETHVLSMLYDSENKRLYLGTEAGVFVYRQ